LNAEDESICISKISVHVTVYLSKLGNNREDMILHEHQCKEVKIHVVEIYIISEIYLLLNAYKALYMYLKFLAVGKSVYR